MSSLYTFRRSLLCAALLTGVAHVARAQASSDTVFRRAKRLVAEGNGTAGRAIVDSVLRGATEGTPAYGDALYWRGALAETAADAERDYRRVIVEYPLSQYSDQALLAMADLETARGDRAAALQHLQRFVKEHPANTPARGAAAMSAARLAFEQRDTRAGCAMISAARASTPTTSVETRNQIDYLGARCTSADLATTTAAPTPAPNAPAPARDTSAKAPQRVAALPPKRPVTTTQQSSPAPAPVAKQDTAPAPTPVVKTPAPVAPAPAAAPAAVPVPAPAKRSGSYTIQLAAYNTKPDAERLVTKLKSKGVTARVSGDAKPFRVRLAFFPTRQAAQEEVNHLKTQGIIGFVTTETPPPAATP